MAIKVLIVFATSSEAEVLGKLGTGTSTKDSIYFEDYLISPLVTGVGGISTAWSMKKWLSINPGPDLAINAGIAGSFNDDLKIGDVVLPVTDCFADLGLESEGRILTLFEAGLMNPDVFPFVNGAINSENEYVDKASSILRKVRSITVNTCSGSATTIERLKNKFNPDIETMEGATFFYICAMEKIPFISLRAISNKVEPRNREKWNIPFALQNLAERLKEILLMLN
jgi:futalosine hydrolase